jgi:hypothetical protein
MNLRAIATIISLLIPAHVAVSQTAAPRVLALDQWSGLILLCEVDAKLQVPPDLCSQIYAEAAQLAAAAKMKLVTLVPGDEESGKVAKAKAAGFDDNRAVEMLIRLRPAVSKYRSAAINVNALSRLHPVPVQVAGKPDVFQKVYTQGADLDNVPDWVRHVAPTTKIMMQGFFEMYGAPAPVKK